MAPSEDREVVGTLAGKRLPALRALAVGFTVAATLATLICSVGIVLFAHERQDAPVGEILGWGLAAGVMFGLRSLVRVVIGIDRRLWFLERERAEHREVAAGGSG